MVGEGARLNVASTRYFDRVIARMREVGLPYKPKMIRCR